MHDGTRNAMPGQEGSKRKQLHTAGAAHVRDKNGREGRASSSKNEGPHMKTQADTDMTERETHAHG